MVLAPGGERFRANILLLGLRESDLGRSTIMHEVTVVDVYGYMPLRFLTTEVAGRLAVWETGQDQQRSAGGS